MLDCTKCKWSNPETCRICKAEQREGVKFMEAHGLQEFIKLDGKEKG